MKDSVVRARIEPQLKEQASQVLEGCGLEMSDAIRLFLRQVVLHGGMPFSIKGGAPRQVSGRHLWSMKRKAQAQDHAAAASGAPGGEAVLLLRPGRLAGVKVEWPDAPLRDE